MISKIQNYINNLSLRQRQTIIFTVVMAVGLTMIAVAIIIYMGPKDFSTWTNSKLGISIQYPTGWQVVNNPVGGAVVVFVSPKENPLDAFQENVSIVTQDLSRKPMTLTEYSNTAVAQIKKGFGAYASFGKSGSTTLAGRPAYKLDWSEGRANENPLAIHLVHTWCVKNNVAYQINYGGLVSKPTKYMDLYNAMLKSFTID